MKNSITKYGGDLFFKKQIFKLDFIQPNTKYLGLQITRLYIYLFISVIAGLYG